MLIVNNIDEKTIDFCPHIVNIFVLITCHRIFPAWNWHARPTFGEACDAGKALNAKLKIRIYEEYYTGEKFMFTRLHAIALYIVDKCVNR